MKKRLKALNHQTVVVVGASSGIGRATALEAARRGARVVAAARNREALDSLVQEIESAGGQALAVEADVSSAEQVERIGEEAKSRFGGFDTWVNVAATAVYSPFSDMQAQEFERIVQVNLLGSAYGAMTALKHLRAKGGGAVIFISSIEGQVAMPYHTAYAASKHGINGMFDALRLELAHAGSPVSVTCVMPTGVNTPFFNNALSRIGVKPRPPRPIYQPEHVVEAVLYAAEHPVRELFVGGAAKFFTVAKRFTPRLLDSYLLSSAFRSQRTRQPKTIEAPASLYKSETGDQRIHGDYSAETKSVSCYTWLQTHPGTCRLLKGLALLLGVGWLSERLNLWDRDDAWAEARRTMKKVQKNWA